MKMCTAKKILIIAALINIGQAFATPAQEELEQAYRREQKFLFDVRDQLSQQRKKIDQRARVERNQTESRLRLAEKELVALQAENEKLTLKVQNEEKQRREILSQSTDLDNLGKKMAQLLLEVREQQAYAETLQPDDLTDETKSLAQVQARAQLALALLEDISSVRLQPGAYLDKAEQLQAGPIIRVGAAAALVPGGDGVEVLGPSSGHLRVVEQKRSSWLSGWLSAATQEAGLTPLYVFDSLRSSVQLTKASTWVDQAAGLLPIIVLVMLFAVVAWLFFRLARL
ncbi:MAG: hypothetical protein AB7N80_05600 [Bdellovibrionales bacterium]